MTETIAVRQNPGNEQESDMWIARAPVDGVTPSELICYGRYAQ
jgi:hypothetical protein